MRNVRVLVRNAVVVAALSAALSACVVYPARGYYVGPTVAVAPPPPPAEVIGVAPSPGYVWIGGYYNWVGGRHVWVNGYWSAPRPGYRWEPHRWVQGPGGGWRLARGHWVRR